MSSEKNFNLKDVIDVNVLQNIQDRLSEITGIAFITVDFKGVPVNKYSNFSDFCKRMRSTEEGRRLCYASDAHAGLESAIMQKPYIFKCHAGLVDFSAPIIVNGQYLGAILCGQVRTNNKNLSPMSDFKNGSIKWKKDPKFVEYYENTISIDYEEIESVASLIYLVVNQLAEKSVSNLLQEELNNNKIKLMQEQKARLELEKELKISELKVLQSQVNPHFLFNVLNSIARLALIEGAKKTQEMVYSLAELFRYTLKNVGHEVILGADVENLSKYLKIQAIRFSDRIRYKIDIDEDVKSIKIPSMVLYCFVENAIIHGLYPKEKGGIVIIRGYMKDDHAIVIIKDNGLGIPEEKLSQILDGNKQLESKSTGIGIYNTNERLARYYGEEYRAKITSKVDVGTIIRLKFPVVQS